MPISEQQCRLYARVLKVWGFLFLFNWNTMFFNKIKTLNWIFVGAHNVDISLIKGRLP
jgi:hypothetical protein